MVVIIFVVDSLLVIMVLVCEGGIVGVWYEWSKVIVIVMIMIFFVKFW